MNTSPLPLLQAQALSKRYGDRQAVADISLDVCAGEMLGLLGPNGAGKSTTISMICGLTPPDAGQVRVGGDELAVARAACQRRIGLVTQELALVDDLSARANVELFGSLYGLSGVRLRERTRHVLAQVGLSDRAGDKPGSFSGGMKRRLHIACALVHDPAVLLLDEPTAGVDPQSRNAIFETLIALKAQGKALVYTTHYMEEVERLADRIVIVDHGRVVAEGSLADLVRRLPATHKLGLVLDAPASDTLRQALVGLPAVRDVQTDPNDAAKLELALQDLTAGSAAVLEAIAGQGASVRSLTSGRASLEDVFLSLTGRQLRD